MKYIIKTANLLIFVAIIANHQLQLGYFFEMFFFHLYIIIMFLLVIL
jgi:hypothetical protein